jgi:hypothetical protein
MRFGGPFCRSQKRRRLASQAGKAARLGRRIVRSAVAIFS